MLYAVFAAITTLIPTPISSLLRTVSCRGLKNLQLHTPWLTRIAKDRLWKTNRKLSKLNAENCSQDNNIKGTLLAIGRQEEGWQRTKIGAIIRIISRGKMDKTAVRSNLRKIDWAIIKNTTSSIARGSLKRVMRSASLLDLYKCAAKVPGPRKESQGCISFIASQGTRNL